MTPPRSAGKNAASRVSASFVADQLRKASCPAKARVLPSFFRTGMGEYGEGDVFLGVSVPDQRNVAARCRTLSLAGIRTLLRSRVHEHRFTALLILVGRYRTSPDEERTKIANFYLSNTGRVNNWDLVDLSANHILGAHLVDRDRSVLDRLAVSRSLWERRIAIIATFAFIRRNDFKDTLRIATTLLHDDHDLIHKAVGWMLREVGKRDRNAAEAFLDRYAAEMPRTMLRYAIERFPERKRAHYLKKSRP